MTGINFDVGALTGGYGGTFTPVLPAMLPPSASTGPRMAVPPLLVKPFTTKSVTCHS